LEPIDPQMVLDYVKEFKELLEESNMFERRVLLLPPDNLYIPIKLCYRLFRPGAFFINTGDGPPASI
jgi:hypothetical protein